MIAAVLMALGAALLWLVRRLAHGILSEGLTALLEKPQRRLAAWLAEGRVARIAVPLSLCLVVLAGGLVLFLRSINVEVVSPAERVRGVLGAVAAAVAVFVSLWLNDAWVASGQLRAASEPREHQEPGT